MIQHCYTLKSQKYDENFTGAKPFNLQHRYRLSKTLLFENIFSGIQILNHLLTY